MTLKRCFWPSPITRMLGGLTVILAAVLVLPGCGSMPCDWCDCEPCDPGWTGPAMDSEARIVEITLVAGVYVVDDLTDLSSGEKFQWHNDTDGEVTLVFNDVLWDWTYTIGPDHFSPVHTVGEDAPAGTSLSYTVVGSIGDEPDPPHIGTGP